MFKKLGLIVFGGLLLAGVMSASASAADWSATNSWVWESVGDNVIVNFTKKNESSDSLYVTSGAFSTSRIFAANETGSKAMIVSDESINFYDGYGLYGSMGLDDGQFYLSFLDGRGYTDEYTITYSEDYSVYVLTLGGAKILVSDSITPSAVPVPGSALILGSSILCLIGIGSRRKNS